MQEDRARDSDGGVIDEEEREGSGCDRSSCAVNCKTLDDTNSDVPMNTTVHEDEYDSERNVAGRQHSTVQRGHTRAVQATCKSVSVRSHPIASRQLPERSGTE